MSDSRTFLGRIVFWGEIEVKLKQKRGKMGGTRQRLAPHFPVEYQRKRPTAAEVLIDFQIRPSPEKSSRSEIGDQPSEGVRRMSFS